MSDAMATSNENRSDRSAKKRRATTAAALVGVILAGLSPAVAQPSRQDASRRPQPNIVLIVIDDAAFMDLGAFGGEAHTPNIDSLAARGAMFTGYHTSPLCSPSRAMLLTGVDNHKAGVATIEEVLPPEQRGKPGYGLHFEPGVLTIADRLRGAGYRTLMSGKWHLGHGQGDLPNSHGFDRSLALDASGADNWEQKPYMPYYDHAPWFEDGKPATLPAEFYSSHLLVDRLIHYIDEDKTASKPFFGYLAFQAVHIPVQAPKEYSDHYQGVFDKGWDALRADRQKKAVALGLIPQDAKIAGMPPGSRKWSELSPEDRRVYARSMEVYSGMLEAMDASVGRLLEHLRQTDRLENTVFIVTSDNGPEPSDPVHAQGMDLWMKLHGYAWNFEHLGERGSLAFIGQEWAGAVASPGYLFKFYTPEGGVHVPLVISGAETAAGKRIGSPAFLTDIAPTILDYAGVTATPGAVPMIGSSLRPVLTGLAPKAHSDAEPIGIEVSGNSALYRGDFKLVRIMSPFGDGKWRLYNLAKDPGETSDLSEHEPDLKQSMLADYDAYAKKMGVLDLPKNYDVQRQVKHNALDRQLGFAQPFLWALAGGALAILAIAGIFRWRRGKR